MTLRKRLSQIRTVDVVGASLAGLTVVAITTGFSMVFDWIASPKPEERLRIEPQWQLSEAVEFDRGSETCHLSWFPTMLIRNTSDEPLEFTIDSVWFPDLSAAPVRSDGFYGKPSDPVFVRRDTVDDEPRVAAFPIHLAAGEERLVSFSLSMRAFARKGAGDDATIVGICDVEDDTAYLEALFTHVTPTQGLAMGLRLLVDGESAWLDLQTGLLYVGQSIRLPGTP